MKHWNKFLRFSVVVMLIQITLGVIELLLSRFAGISFGAGVSGAVPPLLAGMMVAQWDFENGKWDPSKNEMWREAVSVGAVGYVVSIVFGGAVMIATGGIEVFALIGPVGWILVLILMGLLFVLMTRAGMGIGVRGARKTAERKK